MKIKKVIAWTLSCILSLAIDCGGNLLTVKAKQESDTGRIGYVFQVKDYVDVEDETCYGITGDGIDYAMAQNEHDLILQIPMADIEEGQYEIHVNYSYKGENTYVNLKTAGTDSWFAIPGSSIDQLDVFGDYAFDQGGFTYTGKARSYALTNQDTIEIYRGGEWIWIHSIELVPTGTYEAKDFSVASTAVSDSTDYVYSDDSQGQLVEIPLTGIQEGQYIIDINYSYCGENTYARLEAGESDTWYMIPGTSQNEWGVFDVYTCKEDSGKAKLFQLSADDTLRFYRGGKDDSSDSWIWINSITLKLKNDVNMDGVVNCKDVQTILGIASGEISSSQGQTELADQNNDGIVTAVDGLLLLKKIV